MSGTRAPPAHATPAATGWALGRPAGRSDGPEGERLLHAPHPVRAVVVELDRGDAEVAAELPSSVNARSRASSSRWWATVTWGWYGKSSRRSTGPERTARSRASHWPMPSETCTKTTGETGRNVPVPDRTMRNGADPCSPPPGARGSRPSRRRRWLVGGSSVTCGGMAVAIGSPNDSRASWRVRPQGSGMVTATPCIGMVGDPTPPPGAGRRRPSPARWCSPRWRRRARRPGPGCGRARRGRRAARSSGCGTV